MLRFRGERWQRLRTKRKVHVEGKLCPLSPTSKERSSGDKLRIFFFGGGGGIGFVGFSMYGPCKKIKLQIQNNKIVMLQVSNKIQTRYVFGKSMCVLPPS